MSIFNIFKSNSCDELNENQNVILKKMDIIFEESISKAEAFEKLGRDEDAKSKYKECFLKLSDIVEKNKNNYMYPLKAGELVMRLAYTNSNNFFEVAKPWYQMVINRFSDDKNADLTITYWRLGLIEERFYKNSNAALNFYKKALISPKGRKISEYQKEYDLSAVNLSLALFYMNSDQNLAKQYALKRLNTVKDCPQAKDIMVEYSLTANKSNFDAMQDKNTGTISLNTNIADNILILEGEIRTLEFNAAQLGCLLVLAKQVGWKGGKKLFDIEGKILKFTDSPYFISRIDAINLGEILNKLITKHDDSSQEGKSIKDILNFFNQGSFTIVNRG